MIFVSITSIILIHLCLLSYPIKSLQIFEYYKESNEGLDLHSSISIQNRIESVWIIVINNETIKEKDLAIIDKIRYDYVVLRDHCEALRGTQIDGIIALKIYCNITVKDGTEEEGKKLILNHTLTFINNTFRRENVHIQKNIWVGNIHSSWHTTSEHLNQIVKWKLGENSIDKENAHFLSSHHPHHHNKNKKNKTFSYYIPVIRPESWPEVTQLGVTWGLDRIDQRFGFADGKYHYYNMASDIDIYIIDTGIRTTHVDFEGRAILLTNTVDNVNTDCNGHGTHVAGIAGSKTYGVTKNATLIGVKVLDCAGNGDLFTIQAGVMAVIQNVQLREGSTLPKKKRSVVNLSLGGSKSSLLDQAILQLVQNGLTVTVSAGNLGADACNSSPANLGSLSGGGNNIITVGASDIADTKPSWSNYGECVTLSAPGKGIVSLWNTDDYATKSLDGTSMASPFAVGVTALLLQSNLALTVSDVNELMILWSTPRIISGTTYVGGGSNLLFSLIVYNESAPNPPPSSPSPLSGFPVLSPFAPPSLVNEGSDSLPNQTTSLTLITLLFFFVLHVIVQ